MEKEKEKVPFINFLRVGTKESMLRLIALIAAWSAVAATLGAIVALFFNKFDVMYGAFVLSLWAASIGGKNWAKNVELKPNKETTDELH